ncbi:argininosuccinate synthase-related protein [Photobacterium halotolerans]|uniref:argininosuccinate synthase n=1 Tax=Photobacterium halotolerans TaxID=265726 RepID=A0A7X5AU05_9GAMM|nr:argininosuccinate synthase-related protein [Photobacterium halotolerans]NAW66918.1 argininosuccinate synthase [Photobacterium halotolerans]
MRKIRSIEDLSTVAASVDHVLTLFSGGLDSSYILEVFKQYPIKVTALAVDLGDGIDEEKLHDIASHFGVELMILDARQEFVEHSIVAAIQAQAMYLGDYPVSSSISRPIIVKKAVEVAKQLGCDAIVHTANQSQNSLRRLNGAIERSGYTGFYGSPYEYSAITREEKMKVLTQSGLLVFSSRNVSGDSNLWCREFESGVLDNPELFEISESLMQWSTWQEENQLHESQHELKIGFKQGVPVTLNEQEMGLLDMITYLNICVGAYEVGRFVGFDHLEEDEKVLEVREAPAALVLMKAYKHLETAILPTDLLMLKSQHQTVWTMEAVEGRWESMLQQASYALIAYTAKTISGSVTFRLSRGNLLASSIKAEHPRYITDRDNWEINTARKRSLRRVTPMGSDETLKKYA